MCFLIKEPKEEPSKEEDAIQTEDRFLSNIALTVIELGVDALNTHEYIRNMDKENSEPFASWFTEYMTKFSLNDNEPPA